MKIWVGSNVWCSFLAQAFEIGAFGATEANGELVVLPCADWPLKAEFVRERAKVTYWYFSGHDGVAWRELCNSAIISSLGSLSERRYRRRDLVTEGGSLGYGSLSCQTTMD